jgi:hypothetical protein
MEFPTPEYDWVITEKIALSRIGDGQYLALRFPENGRDVMLITFFPDGKMWLNGQFVDVGDDFMPFVSMFDEMEIDGERELWEQYISCPYEDEDETPGLQDGPCGDL